MEKNGLGEDLPRVKLEIMALKSLCHQHICKLYQVLETVTHYFIVIEYCCGGELFDHIVEKNRLSETQSRTFFRQILSAVAYLHSVGYAHRDLKPENVLLNGDKVLKLIDFGLCAKPEGGTSNPLSTSCGSPTYAAPELVMGHQYLGAEVDVWSMGVLLYTLLCGFLPFDDHNIDSLYKKILSGKYTESSFLSASSKNILKSMLQVDPKRRITIKQLLSHSWITADSILEPVTYHSENIKRRHEECVSIMAKYHNTTSDEMWKNIRNWNYDYNTATYLLLCSRRERRLLLKLHSTASRSPVTYDMIVKPFTNNQMKNILQQAHTNVLQYSPATPLKPPRFKNSNGTLSNCSNKPQLPMKSSTVTKSKMCSPQSPFIEPTGIRKPLKRNRSFTSDTEYSPVPAKKPATPNFSSPYTPERKPPLNTENHGSARKVLGSIERSLNRVRHVLRPRKMESAQQQHPAILTNKNLCNVSTTQCNDPEFVIMELSQALRNKGIRCERKGFRLRGKLESDTGSPLGGCSFELEICFLPSMFDSTMVKNFRTSIFSTPSGPTTPALRNCPILENNISTNGCTRTLPTVLLPPAIVGIRRKRLKGNSWRYKNVCEEVLALTAVGFRHCIESDV